MSMARKTLRLGKGLEHIKAAKVAMDKRGGDDFLKYCAVGRQVGYAGYLTLDTATYVSAFHLVIRRWADLSPCATVAARSL